MLREAQPSCTSSSKFSSNALRALSMASEISPARSGYQLLKGGMDRLGVAAGLVNLCNAALEVDAGLYRPYFIAGPKDAIE